jgi:hypothetical protein
MLALTTQLAYLKDLQGIISMLSTHQLRICLVIAAEEEGPHI